MAAAARILPFVPLQKLLRRNRRERLSSARLNRRLLSPMDVESSAELLVRVRAGDRDALERLLHLYVPALRRWARGRLPRWARDLAETEDLVHDAVLKTFHRLDTFEYRAEGALQAYLRQAVMNRIRDECRRVGRRPAAAPLDDEMPGTDKSPLERAIGTEGVERYEAALLALRQEDREAIVARIEMGYSYAEVAVMLGKPSADAARVAVSRALVRLAEELRRG